MPKTTKKPTRTKLRRRDVTFMKPRGHENWLTLAELSDYTGKDPSWLRKLEGEKRIPVAKRFAHGELSIRLWSPREVMEIKKILAGLKPGRPRKS